MTEAEWLACLELSQLAEWHPDAASDRKARKARLFTVACCRRIWGLIDQPELRAAVEEAERFADGLVSQEELWATHLTTPYEVAKHDVCNAVGYTLVGGDRALYFWEATHGARFARTATVGSRDPLPIQEQEQQRLALLKTEEQEQGKYFHCVFGNPFRPVAFSPSWSTSTVHSLASQMYESRDFSAMPILGDALQDAGCASADVLNHCRGEGPHVRGCWVVDLLLGKE
ncbi:Uncharacterized protein OS=Sorangium cellulosum (strain So ce56) GN=sce5710 PE=4 SV=1 [Gemmata massiliana]|uniref:SMI1/KNR4 family protein n=1 Tax=Gemmata massiliana TaxID=1210884 RepID=A0A6P2D1M2_9BACT|nr:hypothetical protein [Gemmata massiliana]VTR93322.1 Uncharacterized protein OS=Sorangium cellulosum (strain So ce56) GN=sce5710 PE=4 SV=1 [Gemmata massiliana]